MQMQPRTFIGSTKKKYMENKCLKLDGAKISETEKKPLKKWINKIVKQVICIFIFPHGGSTGIIQVNNLYFNQPP